MKLTISEELSYSTIRIECVLQDGHLSTGTGFIFSFSLVDNKNSSIPLIFTNKHVIENAKSGKLIFTRANDKGEPINNEHYILEMPLFEKLWKGHPNADVDLCAMPLAAILIHANQIGKPIFYKSFSEGVVLNERHNNELSTVEEVLMIGYPNGLWDSVNNMPIFRKGITASHPMIDYNGKKEIMIDIAVFPGSSGSPVMVYNADGYKDKNNNVFMGHSRLILLGILYAGPTTTAEGEVIKTTKLNEPIVSTEILMNLGIVIKAERILEMKDLFLT